MRRVAAIATVLLFIAGCESRKSERKPAAATAAGTGTATAQVELGDLSTTLEPVRTAFNAHKGEVRFLTLLSPT